MLYHSISHRLISALLFFFFPFFLFGQGWQWGRSFGGSNSDMGEDMVLDASGNVYSLSNVVTSVNFGSGSILTHGNADALVTKHDVNGQLIWYSLIGGSGSESGNSITMDASGNIYVTGSFHNTMICGSDTLIAQVQDIFIVKLDPSGQILWGKSAGATSGNGSDSGFGISFSNADNSVVVTGYVPSGNSVFGPYTINSSSIVLCKLDANGNWLWAYPVGTTALNIGSDVLVNPAGDIYLTGNISSDMFLKKFTPAGAEIWSANSFSSASSFGRKIALDQAGNVYVAGTHSQYISFGSIYVPTPSNGAGGFWVKYDSSGNALLAQGLSSSSIYCNSIAVNASGDVFVAGMFRTSLYSDTTFLFDIYLGNADGFVAKYNASGSLVWMKQVGTSQDDILYDLKLYNGKIFITGYISGTPNASIGSIGLHSNYGGPDVIVAQFDDCSPPYTTVTPGFNLTFCEGDTLRLYSSNTSAAYTYQWQGNGTPLPNGTGTSLTYVGTALSSGAYAVQISSAGCTYTSHYVSVIFNPLPVVNITRINYGATCNNDSVKLIATYLSTQTYQWLRNNAPIAGATSSTYMAHVNGNYRVITTSSFGCFDTTNAVLVTIGHYPNIIAWGDTAICQGEYAYLNAAGDASSYQWTPFTSVASPNSAMTTTSTTVTTTYRVIGTTIGCRDTGYVTVQVNPLPAQPGISFNNPLISCLSTYYSYQWYLNGNLIVGATGQTYMPTVNGNYSLVVTDSLGCSNTSGILPVILLGTQAMAQGEFSLQIYPQPLHDCSLLQFPYAIDEGEIMLFATTGELVVNDKIANSDQYVLHRGNLAAGLYFVKLITPDGVHTARVVIE